MIKKLFLVISFSLVLSACLPNIAQEDTGPKVKDEQFTKGAVSKNFPKIPLFEKAKIIESYSSGDNHGAYATVDAELGKVVEFYQTGLDFYKWEYVLRQVAPTNYVFEVKSSEHEGQVYVNTALDGKTTAITISVAKR